MRWASGTISGYMQRLRAGLGIDIEDMRGNVSPESCLG